MNKLKSSKIRYSVFIPGLIMMLVLFVIAVVPGFSFENVINAVFLNLMKNIGWIFGPSVLFFLGIMCFCIFGRVGRVVIGGENAKHILRPFSFFSVLMTAITATGMLFYGVAEPVYHYMNPPGLVDIEGGSDMSIISAMGITFTHWTFAGFSIYSVLSIAVALGVYNLKYDFSLGATLKPIFGNRMDGALGAFLDILILLSAILGGIFVLGQVMLSISYGMSYIFDIDNSKVFSSVFTIIIISFSIIFLKSGLTKAVKNTANFNMVIYYVMLILLIISAPVAYCIGVGVSGLGYYFDNFFLLTLNNGYADKSEWASIWTIAHYGSWAGYGPIMAVFLAKISRGYTIRQFTFGIFIGGSAFYFLWFCLYGVSGINLQESGLDIYSSIKNNGFESGIYVFFEAFPLAKFLIILYLFASIISFISTLVGQLDGIASLCSNKMNATHLKPSFALVVFWGVSIGFVAWLCANVLGFRGVRIFASFSGIVGIFISIASGISLVWIFMHLRREHDKYIIDEKSIDISLYDYFKSGLNLKRFYLKVLIFLGQHRGKRKIKKFLQGNKGNNEENSKESNKDPDKN